MITCRRWEDILGENLAALCDAGGRKKQKAVLFLGHVRMDLGTAASQ